MKDSLKSFFRASPYYGGLASKEILCRNVRHNILASDSSKSELLTLLAEYESEQLRVNIGGNLLNTVLPFEFRNIGRR